jgi:choline dehydrogenase-like flavoprotein
VSRVSFQPDGPLLSLDADVVIVGSGAGGAAAAEALSEAGLSTLTVEAGAWHPPQAMPADFYGALRDLFDDWQSTMALGPALWPVVQARCVGGTTVINSAIRVRTPVEVIAAWGRDHGLDAARYARELERHQDHLDRAIGVEAVTREMGGTHNALAERGARAHGGHDHAMVRYTRGCEGQGRCTIGCRAGRKQSLDLALLPSVLARGGTIVDSAPVSRIVLQGSRAVGVAGRFVDPRTRQVGAPFELRARRAVVLAASATHTPALLLRSGLRGRAIGHHFRSHPGAGVLGVYDDPVDLHRGATQGWASLAWRDRGYKLETLSLPLQMLAARMPGGGTALVRRLAQARHVNHLVLGLNARAVGRVNAGPNERPIVRYTLGRDDLERLREGLHLLARLHVSAGATEVLPGLGGLPPALPADRVDDILRVPLRPRNFLCILSHLFGGATLGGDPRTSACDPRGRVWGTQGLVVACAAAIPTTLGVNPQSTIMALARMRAEEIVEDRVVRAAG